MTYRIEFKELMDETCAYVYRNGKLVCSTTWLGETDDQLIVIAEAHAKERGL